MPVVTKYSSAAADPASFRQPKSINAEARVLSKFGKVAIANGDSSTSKLRIGPIPSSARILPQSTVIHTAVTGVTALDVGFDENANVLANDLNITSAGTKAMLASVATADLDKQVWQLAGYAADPGKEIWIVATLGADASAAGTLIFEIYYAVGY